VITAVLILAVGLMLSAFFSGSETGFYRANRLRLMLDALGGDFVARGLLALTNHASIFVATVLVGNNIANYLVSLAIVLGAQRLFAGPSHLAEIIAPLALAPLLFIYGESLPKYIFYQAPNRLLRRGGVPLLICTAAFLPVTGLLWAFSKILESLAGESPQRAQLGLARKELSEVFEEGHEAGILRPAQRGLAQGLFAVANQPVRSFLISPGRVPRVREGSGREEILRLARRHRLPALPVESAAPGRELIGYVRVIDLHLNGAADRPPIRPLVEVPAGDSYLSALMRLETSNESLGRVTNAQGQTLGFLTARHLSEPLFRG
jgi:CBS domain containing-hemolysin-like protein